MTTYHLGGTDLAELTEALADDDRFLVNNKSDTTTAPADADGSSQWIDGITAARAFLKKGYQLIALDPSDSTGTANAAAIMASNTALGGNGTTRITPGAFKVAAGTVSTDGDNWYIEGDSPGWSTRLVMVSTATGDLIRMTDSSNWDTRVTDATRWGFGVRNLAIDASAVTGAVTGVHIGDTMHAVVENVQVIGFTNASSIGVRMDNAYYQTEQAKISVYSTNCKTGLKFTQSAVGSGTSSGSHMRSDIWYDCNQGDPTFDGFAVADGCYLDGGRFLFGGNFGGSPTTALTSCAVRVSGSSPAGSAETGKPSNLANLSIAWNVECDANTHTPTTFIVDSGSGCFVGTLFGGMVWDATGPNWTPTSALIVMQGYTSGDPGIVAQTTNTQLFQGQVGFGTYAGGASLASNGTIATTASWAIVAPTANVTGVILQAGAWDGQPCWVYNGSSFAVTFAASGTSNVIDGTTDLVPPNSLRQYMWSVDSSLWVPVVAASRQRVILGTAFNSATGTSAQTVTGMSIALAPGTYKITAWVPMGPHGTTGSTQKLAWTFGGTASSAWAKWLITGATTSTTAAGNSITTASSVSPTMASTGLVGEFAGQITVTAAGTLQLTVTSGTSGDECTIPVGAYIDIEPLA